MAKILTDFEERAGLQAIEFASGQNYGESHRAMKRSNQPMTLASPKLPCGVIANAADRLAGLLLLRQPVANMLDVVEDEATYFRAWRPQASSSEARDRL